MKKIQILQISEENWAENYPLPENLNWKWIRPENITALLPDKLSFSHPALSEKKPLKPYDVVVVDTVDYLEYIPLLDEQIDVYRLFYSKRSRVRTNTLATFLKKKRAICKDFDDPLSLIHLFSRGFYQGQYGDKLGVKQLKIDPHFEGKYHLQGTNYLELQGDFGNEFRTIATYLYNIVSDGDRPIEIWPEFIVSEGCDIRYMFHGLVGGSEDFNNKKLWVYDSDSFDKPFILDSNQFYYVSVTIEVKGTGNVCIGPCHFRQSHMGYGNLLVGGGRVTDSRREELIYYFYPGDMKPPLNVYFSGYRPAEGFEGYYLMKLLGTPFLLIGDPRAEGGAFYLGSEELENKLVSVVQGCLDDLGFSNDQLILSGLSMGTFGALYYGARLCPHAIVVGKPLASLGTMAEAESTTRPGGFPTSLDLVYRTTGSLSLQATEQLNQRFWSQFDQGDFSMTQFIISYMYHDDYDITAYQDLVEHLSLRDYPVKVIGKGLVGRHNDDSDGIIQWFYNQYKSMLSESFGRRFDN